MENKIKKYYGQYGQDSIIKQFFDHKNINNLLLKGKRKN